MINYIKTKKKLIVSYNNLSDDLKALFKETYPDGYQEYLQKAYKPNGEPLFVVPLETDSTSYMIKFDVKVDTLKAEDIEKEMFDTDSKGGDDEYSTMDEAIEKDGDMGDNHTERVLNYGEQDSMLDNSTTGSKKKKNSPDMDELRNELAAEFNTDDDDDDEYKDDYKDEGLDDDDDFEPSDEDIAEIDSLLDDDSMTTTKNGKKNTAKKTTTKPTAKKEHTVKKEVEKKSTKTKASSTKTTTTKKTTKKKTDEK